jgi:hypothetical protein
MDAAALARALAVARRAPSAHNTQPWHVEVSGLHVRVHVDRSRHLAHGDPMERDLGVALGAFSEALRLAAAAEGIALRGVPGAEAGEGTDVFATFRFDGAPDAADREFARDACGWIEARVCSRLPYGPRMFTDTQRTALEAVAARHGLQLHVAGQGSRDAERWTTLLRSSVRETWMDPRATAELGKWLRFRTRPGDDGPSPDGLHVRCMGLARGDAAALFAAAQPRLWRSLEAMLLSSPAAGALADEELRLVREAPQLCLVTRAAGASSAESGAGLLHLWITFARLGLSLHPYSALLDRRGWEVATSLGVDTRQLVFFCRAGTSVAPAVRSGRRAVSAMLTHTT